VNKKRNILLTFDYELFLGKRSGSIDRCVIEPTGKIIKVLNQYKAKAIFFVDTAWLVRLKEITINNSKAKEDYDRVVTQLHQLVKDGHYIFNHLHPHWIDAKYIEKINQWDLSDSSRYRFNSLDNKTKSELFAKTSLLLKNIIESVVKDYDTDGYRAGGWSIQPFDEFKPYFQQYGIKFDFSVMTGMKSITTAQQYDFSGIFAEQPYRFSDDFVASVSGEFTEFPINNIVISSPTLFLSRIMLKYLHLKGDTGSGDGTSVLREVLDGMTNSAEMLSLELLTYPKLSAYLGFLRKHSYMHFISHPKMLSAHNINTFARFMKKAFSEYTVETDFRKMVP